MDSNVEAFAVRVARQAGELMRTNFTLGAKKIWKADSTPLTETDEAINEMVIEQVQATFPDHAIIGEEGSFGDTANAEWVWVCDPIDGTLPFSHGYPTFAFSLGLAHHGKSVFGVIYDPYLDRMIVASEGRGAWLNGERTAVGDFDGFGKTAVHVAEPAQEAMRTGLNNELLLQGAWPTMLNSTVYGGLLLAAGEFSGLVYSYTWPWDCCALDVVIREAGGTVSDLRGETNLYNGNIEGFVAAASPRLHAELLQILNSNAQQESRGSARFSG